MPSQKEVDDKTAAFQRERAFAVAIFTAAVTDDVAKLKRAASDLANDANPQNRTLALTDYKDGEGFTPLHHAAQAGHIDAVVCLMELIKDSAKQRATVNAASQDGTTPLMAAMSRGHENVVRMLLSLGAEVSAARTGGARVIHLAAMAGTPELIALVCAAAKDESAEVNAPSDVGFPLHWAAAAHNPGIITELIKHGAKPDEPNADGVRPLSMAAASGDDKTVAALLDSGKCDTMAASPDGTTALFASAAAGHVHASVLLIKHTPALFWKIGCDGLLPVQVTAFNRHTECAKAMVEALPEAARTPPSDFTGESPELMLDVSGLDSKMKEKRQDDEEEIRALVAGESELAAKCKLAGNDLIKSKEVQAAIVEYTQGIEHCARATSSVNRWIRLVGDDKVDKELIEKLSVEVFAPLLCNRSSLYLQTGKHDDAIKDAEYATKLAPKWPKGHFRLAMAYTKKAMHAEAAQAFWDAHQLDSKAPGAAGLLKLFKKAVSLGKLQHQGKHAGVAAPTPPADNAPIGRDTDGVVDDDGKTYDHDVPVEIPSHEKPLRLRFDNGEAPAEVAGRFISVHGLSPSLLPRIAAYVEDVYRQNA
jgi:ankyrin repeat protein